MASSSVKAYFRGFKVRAQHIDRHMRLDSEHKLASQAMTGVPWPPIYILFLGSLILDTFVSWWNF